MRVVQLQGSQHSASNSGGLRPIVMRVLIMGLAVFLAVTIVPGIESESLGAGLAAVLVLTVLNTLIRPLLYLLALPLIVVSLGLFMVVINALLLQLTAALVKGFTVVGFGASFWGALVISVVSSLLNMILVVEHTRVDRSDRPQRPPTIINPD
ncbi:MAG: phage holin family protein [Nitrospira sp.]|jgi:putative membrane protein|nr:phage holin family protein [Nitrospira sp.]MBP7362899.1 phage holin family protein [Nitrospira sp.]MBP8105905.1 phage holin family protein [Nitrospira sp.]MBP8827659.1 phage holin family protein [Nitrospira sp.]HRC25309.1 phage holin family protein [Nitrospira sp.]